MPPNKKLHPAALRSSGELYAFLELPKLALAESDHAGIQSCSHVETLDRWIENVIGASSISEVLT